MESIFYSHFNHQVEDFQYLKKVISTGMLLYKKYPKNRQTLQFIAYLMKDNKQIIIICTLVQSNNPRNENIRELHCASALKYIVVLLNTSF